MTLTAGMVFEVRNGGSDTLCSGGFRGGLNTAVPPAPAVTGAPTGGTVPAGTYYCVVSHNNGPDESTKSAETSVTVAGATSKFTVTAPAAASTRTSWNLYVSTASGGPYWAQGSGLTLGSDRVVTATPPTSGDQPTGTDRSLQASAQVAIDNSTITTSVTTTVITFTGYVPTAADVGNTLQVVSGTNMTAGAIYEIVAWTATTWTVDRAIPSSGTTANMIANMGGYLATPGKATGAASASNLIALKYSATPWDCSNTSNVAGGRVTMPGGGHLFGYDTTRARANADANRPTLRPAANSVTVVTNTAGIGASVRNIIIANPSAFTGVTGFASSNSTALYNLSAASINIGFSMTGEVLAQNCVATSCATGFNLTGDGVCHGCVATSCTTAGFSVTAGQCVDCVSNGAASSINFSNGTNSWGVYVNCSAYGAQTGFSVSNYAKMINCVSYGASGTDFFTALSGTGILINCAGATKTLWRDDQLVNFVALTADPFTNAAGGDFSLNNTAGGGAACRAAGAPSAYPTLSTTSYPDRGAAQHLDSGAAAGSGIIVRPKSRMRM